MRRNLSLLAIALLAGCGTTTEPEPVAPAQAAEPQTAQLGWRESYPSTGKRLRFEVERLVVRQNGWAVQIAVTNSVGIPFELGRPVDSAFGLMLFETADLGE